MEKNRQILAELAKLLDEDKLGATDKAYEYLAAQLQPFAKRFEFGKYTRAWKDLTDDQLEGLIWALGEVITRVRTPNTDDPRALRAYEVIQQSHHGQVRSKEDVLRYIRDER